MVSAGRRLQPAALRRRHREVVPQGRGAGHAARRGGGVDEDVREALVTALVIGGNGYLGSHVARRLVEDGQDVRVMVRAGANTIGIDDLDVTRFVGDIWDDEILHEAMVGCDVVYYCVVDTRGWLKDPAPLFRTNVEGTRHVLDVAVEPAIAAGLKKFVFTSTYAAVARRRGHTATEDDVITDERSLTPY